MADKLLRIQNKARGAIQFNALGFLLENKGFSHPISEGTLRADPEINSYLQKDLVALVTQEDYEALLVKTREATEKAAFAGSVEDALELDNPGTAELLRRVDHAQNALSQLRTLIEAMDQQAETPARPAAPTLRRASPTPAVANAPSSAATEEPSADEWPSDLPRTAVAGMRPQATTEKYLKGNAVERRKFLKECRDISMLRDIAMWETDGKLKKMAGKAALKAERAAESAVAAAQSIG